MTDTNKFKGWEEIPGDMKGMILENNRNWRSWGSWFSWGSPVGLGIWFVLMATTFWIVMEALR
jgi:hypothetical protein